MKKLFACDWESGKYEDMEKTTTENMEDRVDQLSEIESMIKEMQSAASCAVSCETPMDFDANLDEIEQEAKNILKAIKELRKT